MPKLGKPYNVKGFTLRLSENEALLFSHLKDSGSLLRKEALAKEPFSWKPNYYRYLITVLNKKLAGLYQIKSIYGKGYLLVDD